MIDPYGTANPVAILEQPQGHDPVVHFRAILMGLGRQNGLEFGLLHRDAELIKD